jgi:hypothetical protein
MRLIRSTLITLFFLGMSANAAEPGTSESCGLGWVFFDLGKTLLNTQDWDHLKYLPGALDYLHAVKAAGFHIGAITNIPEAWGKTEDEKIATLKAQINAPWSEAVPFEWSIFEKILVPLTDPERKPALVLFSRAMSRTAPCAVMYESGNTEEVNAALTAGFNQGFVTSQSPEQPFLPVEQILPEPAPTQLP